MIRVNLLPHREQKRVARQRQMSFMAGGVAMLGALLVIMAHTYISQGTTNQNNRNGYLKKEIVKLDKEIEEIKKLREQTRSLLDRKKVVEVLQGDRSQVVYLLDQLARLLPDGVYLKGVKQQGAIVNLQGYAQSNARVSTLMRSLEASPWLELPDLVEIKAATVNGLRVSEFSLNVKLTQTQPQTDAPKKKPRDNKP